MTRKSFRFMADLAGLVLLAAALALSGCEDPNSSSGTSTPADDGAVTIYSHAVSPTRGVLEVSWEAAEGASSYTVKYGLTEDEAKATELDPENVDGKGCTASLPDSAAVAFGTEYYVWVSSDTGVKYSGHGAVHFTEDDLANIGKDENLPLTETYTLSRDLDLTGRVDPDEDGGTGGWIPLGKYDFNLVNYLDISADDKVRIFSGTLDGDNHTIRNLELPQYDTRFIGLFGAIVGVSNKQPAVIKNLTIELAPLGTESEDSNNLRLSLSGSQYAGALAGYAGNVKIENVTVKGGLKITKAIDGDGASGAPWVGGLAGVVFYGAIVEDCTSEVDIDVSYETTVSSIRYHNVYAGGLFGNLSISEGSVVDSAYSGNIIVYTENANTDYNGHTVYAGGIAGSSYVSITGTHVRDTAIKVTGGLVDVGGLTGYTAEDVSYCSFNGNIDVTSKSLSYGSTGEAQNGAGGITGDAAVSSLIEKCWTTSNATDKGIKIKAEGAESGGFAGGIVGYPLVSALTVKNCFTTFDRIEAECEYLALAGGITGSLAVVENCYSMCGSIVAYNSGRNGGIAAGIGNNNQTVKNNVVLSGTIIGVRISSTQTNRISGTGSFHADNAATNYAASAVVVKRGTSLKDVANVEITDGGLNGNTVETVDKDFYTKTLGWSEAIWDFSSLPPTLKPAAN